MYTYFIIIYSYLLKVNNVLLTLHRRICNLTSDLLPSTNEWEMHVLEKKYLVGLFLSLNRLYLVHFLSHHVDISPKGSSLINYNFPDS